MGAFALMSAATGTVHADTVYLAPDEYVRQSFSTTPPPAFLWLNADTQKTVSAILGHPYPAARLRYWRSATRTLWILEEIGKEAPITAGFVIEGTRIADARVLVYRESRGAEVRLPAFLRQFFGGGLNDANHLDVEIDGITGATLSVRAMQRMAEAALALNRIAK